MTDLAKMAADLRSLPFVRGARVTGGSVLVIFHNMVKQSGFVPSSPLSAYDGECPWQIEYAQPLALKINFFLRKNGHDGFATIYHNGSARVS